MTLNAPRVERKQDDVGQEDSVAQLACIPDLQNLPNNNSKYVVVVLHHKSDRLQKRR